MAAMNEWILQIYTCYFFSDPSVFLLNFYHKTLFLQMIWYFFKAHNRPQERTKRSLRACQFFRLSDYAVAYSV